MLGIKDKVLSDNSDQEVCQMHLKIAKCCEYVFYILL